MKKTLILLFFLCSGAVLLRAQTAGVSLQSISNYNQWGWNAIVMQNHFITIATVPAIGGRVMQYDLGHLPSMFVNAAEIGKTYIPSQYDPWHNFGGFKTWPAPQGNWNVNGWPPPPTLDCGVYTVLDTVRTTDSVEVVVCSPIETWFAPGIRFIRKATIYAGTSRVKMEETIVNQGTQSVTWSVWDITQSIVNHQGLTDYQNYWVFFPINPNSRYGPSGVSPQGGLHAWRGEIAPGVYGVQFYPENAKIYADPHKGWIAYASLSDTVVFVKTFRIFEGAQYPDNGCRVTAYVSGPNPAYVEVETKGPMVDLDANGGTYTFTEDWWAARVRAPILDVDTAGVIASGLSYNSASQVLSGVYGVFHEGTANAMFLDTNGQVVSEGSQHAVSPLNEFQLNETIIIPGGAKRVVVQVRNLKGDLIGVLDSVDVSQLLASVEMKNARLPSEFRLEQNFPNPFNPSTVIRYQLPGTVHISLKVFDVLGRCVETLVEKQQGSGVHSAEFDASHLPSGVYVCRLVAGTYTEARKMLLIK